MWRAVYTDREAGGEQEVQKEEREAGEREEEGETRGTQGERAAKGLDRWPLETPRLMASRLVDKW
jgi:hypothetical protein